MLTARPKIAELAFQLYGRSLHPELFVTFRSRKIERTGYKVKLDITSAGHVITLRYQGVTLTEVASSVDSPLPKGRRLLSYKLRGESEDRVECRGGIVYQTSFQLETVTPDIFWTFHQELTADSEKNGLLHVFDPMGRVSLGALSYIHAETRKNSFLVQAFHTFPDECALVKTQSLFQLP